MFNSNICMFMSCVRLQPFTRQFQNEPQVDDDFLTFEEEGNEDFDDAEIGDLLWGDSKYLRN